jgi:GNAT superfamily N-acetyltransferase
MADERSEIMVAEVVDDDVVEAILNGLRAHSLEFTKTRGFLPLALHVRDVQNRIVAGVIGRVNWNWLYVELFWVDESLRGRGLGRRLLSSLEDEARNRGCQQAHVDTFSFQARSFYERCDYEAFAVLDEYPPGHQRVFLKKVL